MFLTATQTWWEGLLLFAWMLSKAVIFPLLVALGLALIQRWLKIKVTEEQRIKMNVIISEAVDFADQKLKKKLADGEEPKDKNAKRMQWALQFLELALGTEYAEMGVDYLEGLIEAKLGEENKYKETLIESKSEDDKKSDG